MTAAPDGLQVNYRPGRIQTLNAEQEIVLKQVWAYILKFYGYELQILEKDLEYKESYVPSSPLGANMASLERSSTARSQTSTASSLSIGTKTSRNSSSIPSKKKSSFFSRKKSNSIPAPDTSKRMSEISALGSRFAYEPVDSISNNVRSIYMDQYKAGFIHSGDYRADDYDQLAESDDSDTESMESFVTANTSIKSNVPEMVEPMAKENSSSVKETPLSTSRANTKMHLKKARLLLPLMSKYDPSEIHEMMFSYGRQDLLDNLILRYVRARKWDTNNALSMLLNSFHWRKHSYPCTEWVMEGDASSYLSGTNPGFIKNYTVSKAFIRGKDREGNPIFRFQSRKHFAQDSPLPETERFAIVTIEWFRLFFREVSEGVDQATVIFDLTGFSMKNNDNAPVKFLTEVFEAHYPESLSKIIIHNAPWIFFTIWNIIKKWLDPVVASKIHFTRNLEEMSHFIHPKHIPEDLGGEDPVAPYYPEPSVDDRSPPLSKDATYQKLCLERDNLRMLFLDATIKWIEAVNPETSALYLKDKIEISQRLAQNYVHIDPYIRAPGIYDRIGALQLGV